MIEDNRPSASDQREGGEIVECAAAAVTNAPPVRASDSSDSKPNGAHVNGAAAIAVVEVNDAAASAATSTAGAPPDDLSNDPSLLEAQAVTQAKWDALKSFLDEYYHGFDHQAFLIALSCAICHKFRDEDPVWLFIVGPAGTGKTVCISAIAALENTHIMGDLTSQTFLSGFNKGAQFSLLHKLGDNATMLFKDFTTFLSKRPEERAQIASQLREVYDGRFSRDTGSVKKRLEWTGKMTVIAATTPAVERAWTLLRDLGERFVTVRWPRGHGLSQASKAYSQITKEKWIKEQLRELTVKFIDLPTLGGAKAAKAPDVLGPHGEILYLAEMVALLRAHVHRESEGKRQIDDIPEPEGPTRLSKALTQLVKAHATLFRRAVPNAEDIKIARRVAMDTIPGLRRRIFETLLKSRLEDGDKELTLPDLIEKSGVPRTSVSWTADEMVALGILETERTGTAAEKWYAIDEKFLELVLMAMPDKRMIG